MNSNQFEIFHLAHYPMVSVPDIWEVHKRTWSDQRMLPLKKYQVARILSKKRVFVASIHEKNGRRDIHVDHCTGVLFMCPFWTSDGLPEHDRWPSWKDMAHAEDMCSRSQFENAVIFFGIDVPPGSSPGLGSRLLVAAKKYFNDEGYNYLITCSPVKGYEAFKERVLLDARQLPPRFVEMWGIYLFLAANTEGDFRSYLGHLEQGGGMTPGEWHRDCGHKLLCPVGRFHTQRHGAFPLATYERFDGDDFTRPDSPWTVNYAYKGHGWAGSPVHQRMLALAQALKRI